MTYIKTWILNHNETVKYTIGIILLLCGCSIYLLFRSKSIGLYQWAEHMGLSWLLTDMRNVVQDWSISDFIRYSLPDGVYCASYILMMDTAWPRTDNRLFKHIAVSTIPFAAILHETLQAFGLAKGTFDVCDLLCYSVPLILYFSLLFYQQLKNQEQ